MRLRPVLLGIIALPAFCHAQSILGIGARAGYTFSGRFTGKSGTSGELSGPEVGLDIPLGLPLPIKGFGGLQFNLSPSYFAGTAGGSDFEGNVYRILATARLNVPGSPAYFRVGAGWSYAAATNSDFSSQSAYETQLGIGLGVLNNLPAVKVSAEVTYHQSSLAQVSGFTISLNARF